MALRGGPMISLFPPFFQQIPPPPHSLPLPPMMDGALSVYYLSEQLDEEPLVYTHDLGHESL